MKYLKRYTFVFSLNTSAFLFVTSTGLFITIFLNMMNGNYLQDYSFFAVMAVFNYLRSLVVATLSIAILGLSDIGVSIKRLNAFLNEIETPKIRNENHCSVYGRYNVKNEMIFNEIEKKSSNRSSIYLKHVNAKWSVTANRNVLTNINISIITNKLVAIIGSVGSGKSGLLYTLLEELPLSSGELIVQGNVSYAAQESWLFSGTIRQNILFGKSMNKARYKEVLRVCSLERDFEMFPSGDKTLVGDRGLTLSGGQKARVNLARAVYREADIYLLDDCLSAVDARVGNEIFSNCFSSFMADKIVLFVTHQLQYLEKVDYIIYLQGGTIQAEGEINMYRGNEHTYKVENGKYGQHSRKCGR